MALSEEGGVFSDTVEADETYFSGRRNMGDVCQKMLTDTGRETVGAVGVVSLKDRAVKHARAKVVERTDAACMRGTHLRYRQLVAPNGLPPEARSV